MDHPNTISVFLNNVFLVVIVVHFDCLFFCFRKTVVSIAMDANPRMFDCRDSHTKPGIWPSIEAILRIRHKVKMCGLLVVLHVLCNSGLNRFRVGAIDNIDLFTVLEIVERRNRSNTLPLHQFGRLWGSITNHLEKYGIGILFTEILKLGSNHLTRSTPELQNQTRNKKSDTSIINPISALLNSYFCRAFPSDLPSVADLLLKMCTTILTMLYCNRQLPGRNQHS